MSAPLRPPAEIAGPGDGANASGTSSSPLKSNKPAESTSTSPRQGPRHDSRVHLLDFNAPPSDPAAADPQARPTLAANASPTALAALTAPSSLASLQPAPPTSTSTLTLPPRPSMVPASSASESGSASASPSASGNGFDSNQAPVMPSQSSSSSDPVPPMRRVWPTAAPASSSSASASAGPYAQFIYPPPSSSSSTAFAFAPALPPSLGSPRRATAQRRTSTLLPFTLPPTGTDPSSVPASSSSKVKRRRRHSNASSDSSDSCPGSPTSPTAKRVVKKRKLSVGASASSASSAKRVISAAAPAKRPVKIRRRSTASAKKPAAAAARDEGEEEEEEGEVKLLAAQGKRKRTEAEPRPVKSKSGAGGNEIRSPVKKRAKVAAAAAPAAPSDEKEEGEVVSDEDDEWVDEGQVSQVPPPAMPALASAPARQPTAADQLSHMPPSAHSTQAPISDPRFALPNPPRFRPPGANYTHSQPPPAWPIPPHVFASSNPQQQAAPPPPAPAPPAPPAPALPSAAPRVLRDILADMSARPRLYISLRRQYPKPHKLIPGFRASRSVPMQPAPPRLAIPTKCTTPIEWFGGHVGQGVGRGWVERRGRGSLGIEGDALRLAREAAERELGVEIRREQRRMDEEWEEAWVKDHEAEAWVMDQVDMMDGVKEEHGVVDAMDVDAQADQLMVVKQEAEELTPDEINQRKTDAFYAQWKYVPPKSQAWMACAQRLKEINAGQRKRSKAADGNVRPGKSERKKKRAERKKVADAEEDARKMMVALNAPRIVGPVAGSVVAGVELSVDLGAAVGGDPMDVDEEEEDEAELRAEHALAELVKEGKKKKKTRPNQRQRLVRFLARNIPPLPEELMELILVIGIRNSKKRRTRNLINVLPSLPNRAKMLAEGRTRFVNVEQATKRGGRYLFNLEMREKRNDPVLNGNKTLMYYASKWGKVDSLDWWLNWWLRDPDNRTQPHYDANALIAAARAGHVAVLDWWRRNQAHFPPKHSFRAIAWASRNGHVDVLEWWFKHSRRGVPPGESIEMMYSSKAMDWASEVGQLKSLDWWRSKANLKNKEDRVKLKYSPNSMGLASRKGKLDVLNWWANSGLKLKYSTSSLKWATENGRLDVLDWWRDRMMDPKYPQIKRLKYNWFTYAKAGKGRPGAREWWAQNATYWAMPHVTRKRQAKQAIRRKRRKKARAQRRSLKQIRANKHPRYVMRNGIPMERSTIERREGRKLPVAPPTPPMKVIDGDGFEDEDMEDAIIWGVPGPEPEAGSAKAASASASASAGASGTSTETEPAGAQEPSPSVDPPNVAGRGLGSLGSMMSRLFGIDNSASVAGKPKPGSSTTAAPPPPPPPPAPSPPRARRSPPSLPPRPTTRQLPPRPPAPLPYQPPLQTQQIIVTTAAMVDSMNNPVVATGVADDLDFIFGNGGNAAGALGGGPGEPDLFATAPMMGAFGGGIGGGGAGGDVGFGMGIDMGMGLGGGGPGAMHGYPPMMPAAPYTPPNQLHGAQQRPPAYSSMYTLPQQMPSYMPGVRPPGAQPHYAPFAPSRAGLPPRPRPPSMAGAMYSSTFHPVQQQQPNPGFLPPRPRPPVPVTPQNQARPPGPGAPPGAPYGNNYPGYQGYGGGNGQGW